jgi:nitroreductase
MKNGKPNRHAFHDMGLIAENMVLQATALGLMVHQMAGIKPEKVRDVFALPEGYEAVTGIAIGYEGDASHLSAELQQRQLSHRSRKPLKEFIFSERWGTPSKAIMD